MCESIRRERRMFHGLTCELLLGPEESRMDVKPKREEGEDMAA